MAGISVDQAKEICDKMSDVGYSARENMMLSAVDLRDTKFCKQLAEAVDFTANSDLIQSNVFAFLRRKIAELKLKDSINDIIPLMNKLKNVGIRIPPEIIGNDLLN